MHINYALQYKYLQYDMILNNLYVNLHHFIRVIYNGAVFALFFGFLKMSDHMVIVSEESELSNNPLNI